MGSKKYLLVIKLQTDCWSNQCNGQGKQIPNHNEYWTTRTAKNNVKYSATFDCEKRNPVQMAVANTEVGFRSYSLVWSRIQSLTHNPFKTSHVGEKIYAQLFTYLLQFEACIRTAHPSISFVTLLWLVTEVTAT